MAISFVLLTPMTIYIGFESAFWTGEFPKLFPSSSIGVVLLCTGVGQVQPNELRIHTSSHFFAPRALLETRFFLSCGSSNMYVCRFLELLH